MLDQFTLKDKAVIKLHNIMSYRADTPTLPFGISFLVIAKYYNEYIEKCLLSILPVSNEIILVDGSSDKNTENLIHRLANEKIRYFKYGVSGSGWQNLADSSNFGLQYCRFRWVFKWDCDMLADVDGLRSWVEQLKRLNDRFYYAVDVGRINPRIGLEFGGYEARLYTQHSKLKYRVVSNLDVMNYPIWFRLLRWDERFITHLNPR